MDESEEELGGRFALRGGGAFFGAGFGFALPLGLPRGRFTGTSCASGSDLARFSAAAPLALALTARAPNVRTMGVH